MTRSRRWIAALSLSVLAACGGKEGPKVAGREAPDALMERGLAELREEQWLEAIQIFERLVLEYPGYARIPEARLHVAEAYMGREEFVTAAGEYLRLANDYPAGPLADDSRFGACEAYRRLSPDIQRDQQYTSGAVEHCESLIAYYPDSEFVARAREIIADMKNKLAEKVYIAGEFYRKNGAFDSAIIYYEDVLEQYPQSTFAPRALLELVTVYRTIGYADEARLARERLLQEYPDSAAAREVQAIALPAGS